MLGLPIVMYGIANNTIYAYIVLTIGGTDEHGGVQFCANRVLSQRLPLDVNDFVIRVADAIEEQYDRGDLKHTYWPGVAWRGWGTFDGRFDHEIVLQVPPK